MKALVEMLSTMGQEHCRLQLLRFYELPQFFFLLPQEISLTQRERRSSHAASGARAFRRVARIVNVVRESRLEKVCRCG